MRLSWISIGTWRWGARGKDSELNIGPAGNWGIGSLSAVKVEAVTASASSWGRLLVGALPRTRRQHQTCLWPESNLRTCRMIIDTLNGDLYTLLAQNIY